MQWTKFFIIYYFKVSNQKQKGDTPNTKTFWNSFLILLIIIKKIYVTFYTNSTAVYIICKEKFSIKL